MLRREVGWRQVPVVRMSMSLRRRRRRGRSVGFEKEDILVEGGRAIIIGIWKLREREMGGWRCWRRGGRRCTDGRW